MNNYTTVIEKRQTKNIHNHKYSILIYNKV